MSQPQALQQRGQHELQYDALRGHGEASIEPAPLNLAQTADLVRQRLQLIDSLRLAVFGKTR